MGLDIVERLEAHMGKADMKDVLKDCREAAAEIGRLRKDLNNARDKVACLRSEIAQLRT